MLLCGTFEGLGMIYNSIVVEGRKSLTQKRQCEIIIGKWNAWIHKKCLGSFQSPPCFLLGSLFPLFSTLCDITMSVSFFLRRKMSSMGLEEQQQKQHIWIYTKKHNFFPGNTSRLCLPSHNMFLFMWIVLQTSSSNWIQTAPNFRNFRMRSEILGTLEKKSFVFGLFQLRFNTSNP